MGEDGYASNILSRGIHTEQHPEMGGEGAVLEPEESVAGLLKVLRSADKSISGKFLRYTGEELPW